jgi:hypothetical protein
MDVHVPDEYEMCKPSDRTGMKNLLRPVEIASSIVNLSRHGDQIFQPTVDGEYAPARTLV